MNEKEETTAAYDSNVVYYEEKTKNYVQDYISQDLELFLKMLNGKRILDLGSGPGRDSLIFKERGFNPICVDISKSMIELCKQKGLEAYEMDMENLSFEDRSFDGVWAYTSLLHLPKDRIENVLSKIKDILKDDGVLYLGMCEGSSEGFSNNRWNNHRRYFSLYEKEELEKILSKSFEIIHFSRVDFGSQKSYNQIYINFLCKKLG
jgi:SAM-dependent methyltransferase